MSPCTQPFSTQRPLPPTRKYQSHYSSHTQPFPQASRCCSLIGPRARGTPLKRSSSHAAGERPLLHLPQPLDTPVASPFLPVPIERGPQALLSRGLSTKRSHRAHAIKKHERGLIHRITLRSGHLGSAGQPREAGPPTSDTTHLWQQQQQQTQPPRILPTRRGAQCNLLPLVATLFPTPSQ